MRLEFLKEPGWIIASIDYNAKTKKLLAEVENTITGHKMSISSYLTSDDSTKTLTEFLLKSSSHNASVYMNSKE